MTLERIVFAVMILIGILMIVLAVLGTLYWGLLLPFAIFIVIGGILLIIITIILIAIII